jgi:hypothetical protein
MYFFQASTSPMSSSLGQTSPGTYEPLFRAPVQPNLSLSFESFDGKPECGNEGKSRDVDEQPGKTIIIRRK